MSKNINAIVSKLNLNDEILNVGKYAREMAKAESYIENLPENDFERVRKSIKVLDKYIRHYSFLKSDLARLTHAELMEMKERNVFEKWEALGLNRHLLLGLELLADDMGCFEAASFIYTMKY